MTPLPAQMGTLELSPKTVCAFICRTLCGAAAKRLSLGFALSVLLCSHMCAATLGFDFEEVTDGSQPVRLGPIRLTNGVVLVAGLSLNEFEIPPRSGSAVLSDLSGPIVMDFDVPALAVDFYITYAQRVQVRAFDADGLQVAIVWSAYGNNLAMSGEPGSSPNELIELASPAGISSVVIAGNPGGSSFGLDDLSVTAIPEPSAAILFLSGLLLLGRLRRGRDARHPRPRLYTAVRVWRYAATLVVCLAVVSGRGIAQIGRPVVAPASVPVGAPSDVVASVHVAPSPMLLAESVMLVRANEAGAQIASLGRMYDDGTYGDLRAGDGVYTTRLHLQEVSPSAVFVRVSVAYLGQVRRVLSPPTVLTFVQEMPPEQALTAIASALSGGDIESALRYFSPSQLNRDILRTLTPAVRVQFAGALRNAALVSARGELRVYEIAWVTPGGWRAA